MELRPSERGNDRGKDLFNRRRICFNGATSFRTWKRDRSCLIAHRGYCFNGATSFRTWKQMQYIPIYLCYHKASMEPRPSERGNNYSSPETLHEFQASMEPRPSERGNCSAV